MIFLAGAPGVFRRFVLPGLFVAALFVALFLRRPDPQEETAPVQVIHGMTMGTTYSVKLVGGAGASTEAEVEAAVSAELEAVNAEMSTYRPESALSKFNAHVATTPYLVPIALGEVVEVARQISEQSGGAFDVTVGPLVDAWGFGPSGVGEPPSDATLEALAAHVGYEKLAVGKSALTKADPALRVDLSAIAKGHGVDRVADRLDALGATRYMVEIGGEIRVLGQSPANRPWRVGIEVPQVDSRRVGDVLEVSSGAVATSGDYRNYREVEGKRISHTIDPRTRRPIDHTLASVTVVHATCAWADGWATALNVLGPVEGPALAKKAGLDVLFIVRAADGSFSELETGEFAKHRVKQPGS